MQLQKKFGVVLTLLGTLLSCAVNDVKLHNVNATMTTEKSEIDRGDTLSISWQSNNNKDCVLSDGVTARDVPASGTESINPDSDTTYVLNCSPAGRGQAGVAQASIKVFTPPSAELTLSADTVSAGDKISLGFECKDSTNAAMLVNGVNSGATLALAGAQNISPDKNSEYTLVCSNSRGKSIRATKKLTIVPLPSAAITADKAQIYLGESITVEWKGENSASCTIKENGIDISTTLEGKQGFKPNSDTVYSASCSNSLGRSIEAQTAVTVIPEIAVQPKFASFAELDNSIDIANLKTACGDGCMHADFDKTRFNADGTPTDDFRAELSSLLTSPSDKVGRTASRKASFNLGTTFAYGHIQSLVETELSGRCDTGFPYSTKDAPIVDKPTFADEIDGGVEALSSQKFSNLVSSDIEISTKAIRGMIKKDSEALVSYKLSGLEAERTAEYMDYQSAKGSFVLNPDGTIKRSLLEAAGEITTRASTFPSNGWFCSAPPAGVSGNNHYPVPPLQDAVFGGIDPNQAGCQSDKLPYYQKCVTEDAVRCTYEPAQPINLKPGWVKIRSRRIVTGVGIAQCKTFFPEVATELGISGDWTATAELQYFVHDASFPKQCQGTACLGKVVRESENDWRFPEVEPATNRCINRWQGLDWNSYRASIQGSCFSAQVYKDAYAKKQQKDADNLFAVDCRNNNLCENALRGMVNISQKFSIAALKALNDKNQEALSKAKAANQSYLFNDAELSPSSLAIATKSVSDIEKGLDIVQRIHAERGSNWFSANALVHGANSIQGFDSFASARDSVVAYKVEINRASDISKPDVRVLGCSYEMSGRFRHYKKAQLGEILLPLKSQESFTSKALKDIFMK